MFNNFVALTRCFLLLCLVLLLATKSLYAFIYMEPFLGYGIGKQAYPYIGVDDSVQDGKSKAFGYSLGMRMGVQQGSWVGGIDASKSSYHFNVSSPDVLVSTLESNGTLLENQYSTKEFGLFVSYLLPAIFRVWVAYTFNNTFTQVKGTAAQGMGTIRTGPGYKFGVGWMPHDFVSVNFEFKVINLDSYQDTDGLTYSTVEEARTTYILQFSLSAPINISAPL
jgi:hypothetical protein